MSFRRSLHYFRRMAADIVGFVACVYVVFVLFANLPYFVDSDATFQLLAPLLLKGVIVMAVLVALTRPSSIIPFLKSPAALLALGIGLVYLFNLVRLPIMIPGADEVLLDVTANRLERFIVFPCAAFIFFSVRFKTIEMVMVAAVIVVPIPVIVNFFYPDLHPGFSPDRAVGTYGNANQAGEAILLWMAIIQHRLRGWPLAIFFAIATIAIILTFSRTGMVVCLLLLGLLALRNRLPKAMLIVPVLLGVFYTTLITQAEEVLPLFIDDEKQIANMIDRLNFIGDVGSEEATDDNSSQGRMEVAQEVLTAILQKPLGGHAVETEYSFFIASHNFLLENWYIYGLLGLILYFWIARNLYKAGIERGMGWINPYLMIYIVVTPFDHQHLTAIYWLMFYAYAMKPISSDAVTNAYAHYGATPTKKRRKRRKRRGRRGQSHAIGTQ